MDGPMVDNAGDDRPTNVEFLLPKASSWLTTFWDSVAGGVKSENAGFSLTCCHFQLERRRS